MKNIMKEIPLVILLLLSCCHGAHAQQLKKNVPDKLVVLTFDDAVLSHYTTVATLLKQYGFGATFFVCEFGKPSFQDKSLYMTWEQIAKLSQMGFEIGNHTWHHTHVNKMDSTRFEAELDYIEKKCREYHIPKPVSFAYPGYDTSKRAITVLKNKGYRYARAGWDRPYDPAADSPYLIPGFTTHTENTKQGFELLQEAKNGKIAVLTIHGVPDDAHPWVNTSVEVLKGYLNYLKENHYTVIAMRDLDKYINAEPTY
ncbi:polysaccharide deacetylase family protein [Mucilaginibacter sp. SP1R1]|uniref:polysaccharide deacetylase family protein n=1 Tax=Mucilaginibacter sp. SP1R1 TaxID=2723091 RepID=UPI0017A5FBFE|nr:polysaccharide deacetylase family protein [Mucilaginibacter sp. SP1R1]MBB6148922.1 peptidoglycan/xylan/chitin deacetylase (PgdA/CDA1 family) [Mucilaginibacter sp. SP1R1]